MAQDDETRRGGERQEPRQTTGGTEREATDVEREGMDLLGRSSVRDGAIDGVSDASARSDQRAEGATFGAAGGGPRRNPPENPMSGFEDGGVSASGGVAGGARGHGGSSASTESLDVDGEPAQHKGTSRANLDHTGDDAVGGRGGRGGVPPGAS